MDALADFEDRLAARLLGLPLDADAAAVNGRFRSLVKAVHPDRNLLDGCVDLGKLADARDRLLARAAARAARQAAMATRRCAADRRLEAMRRQPDPEVVVERLEVAEVERAKARHPSSIEWRPRPSVVTDRFEPSGSLGGQIDLAG